MVDRTTVCARPGQIWEELGGEIVILDLEAGAYYGLNAVGKRVWSLIQKPVSVLELRERLMGEYDVEAERCNRDLLGLLATLESRRMIESFESGA